MPYLKAIAAILVLISTSVPLGAEEQSSSFLKNGDRWLFIGDSITNTDTYRQVVLAVLRHFHPDADLMFGNSAVSGVKSDYHEKREFTPTVVTIMLGMNDVIHRDWSFTPDLSSRVESYRRTITQKVRKYRALGAEVILMTPTYTDERFPGYFNVSMTRRFLEAFGTVCREIAEAEGCHCLPVAEELEAYQDRLGIDQHTRPDGVHPYGLGQYQIARTLWRHLNLAGPLEGKRRFSTAGKPAPIEVKLSDRFLHAKDRGPSLTLTAAEVVSVKARWSLGQARGSEVLQVGPEEKVWQVPVPPAELAIPVGGRKRLIVDLSVGDRQSLYVVDLARTRVLKMNEGKVTGTIVAEGDRPEGKTVANWMIEESGNELWFSGEVHDSDNRWTTGWPFMRDGVFLWLDTRPADRFAGINVDRDVYMAILAIRKQPGFTATLVPWIGPRLAYAGLSGGESTADGYRWRLGIGGNLTDARKFDIRKLDYFGFNLIACDSDNKPKPSVKHFPAHKVDSPDQARCLNLLMIVDRKGLFPGNETTNLHLFGP